MKNTCIKGCQVITPSGVEICNVFVEKGTITALTNAAPDKDDDTQIIDGKGKILIPGMIDQHVHIREPGGPEHENFETGTAAAAVGGVTTVLEMPVSDLPVTSAARLMKRKVLAQEKAYVDFGFYGGVGVGSIERVRELVDAKAIGFKTFLCMPDPHRKKEMAGLWVEKDSDLEDVFRAVASTGLPIAVHAEDGEMIRDKEKEGLRGVHSRTPETEINAVRRATAIAEKTGVRLVLCHLSTFESVEIALEAKKRGADIFIECTPHHLFLNAEDVVGFETYSKVKPPIRSRKNVDKIWGLLACDSSSIDVVASDHAPYEKRLKDLGAAKAPYGIPGLELSLRLLIDAVLRNRITWSRLVSLTSAMPAQIFCIERKGGIRKGADADLVIVDPISTYRIDTEKMITKSNKSAVMYHGKELLGDIDMVMVRGEIVARLGKLTGQKGFGKNVSG